MKPPDFPEAAQATPVRSTTVTAIPRSERKYATAAPITPAPHTTTRRGAGPLISAAPPARPRHGGEVGDVHAVAEHDGGGEPQPLQGEPGHEVEEADAEDARGEDLDEGLDHVVTVVRVEDHHHGQAVDGIADEEPRPLGTQEMREPRHPEHGQPPRSSPARRGARETR